jgi:hypothetical protein
MPANTAKPVYVRLGDDVVLAGDVVLAKCIEPESSPERSAEDASE